MNARSMLSRGSVAAVAFVCVASLLGAAPGAAAAPRATAQPRHGGSVTFGLEAETTGGYCLPNANLAISGIMVVNAIYDTLTTLNDKGQYVPYLAQSVTPNATFDQWTIKLRPNVTFQNGEPLDAAAVKLNLDSYRGANPRINAPLNSFVFANVANVTAVDPLTVVVTTKTPWPAFPAYLWQGGRSGILAPAQLNNPATCSTNMIGRARSSCRSGGRTSTWSPCGTRTTGARASRTWTRSRSSRSPTARRASTTSRADRST